MARRRGTPRRPVSEVANEPGHRRSPDHLIAYATSHGIEAIDVRQAAHEIAHVQDAKLPQAIPWSYDEVYRGALAVCTGSDGKLDRAAYVRLEIRARAIEQIVCRELGEPYDVLAWTGICYMEFARECLLDLLPDRSVMGLARQIFNEAGDCHTILAARSISRLRVEHAEGPGPR